MLRRQHQVGGAEECVGACCEDGHRLLHAIQGETHLGTLAATDPVSLEKFDGFGPVEGVQIRDQAFRVGRDAKHPLTHWAAFHGEPPHLALSIHNLLVGEHGAQTRAPVHRNLRNKGKAYAVRIVSLIGRYRLRAVCRGIHPSTVKLKKDPLSPAEVFGIGRAYFPGPIVTEPERLELGPEVIDVPLGGDARMLARLDRILLGWKAEGIPAHGMEHIISL